MVSKCPFRQYPRGTNVEVHASDGAGRLGTSNLCRYLLTDRKFGIKTLSSVTKIIDTNY